MLHLVRDVRRFAVRPRTDASGNVDAFSRDLAVLPLENLSGDPEQGYFAAGMTEALIGDLARISSLRVISRTSVMRYKQSDKSLPEIARELNVESILEGTVMREGDRIRVTAQLIDARSDTHVWNDSYDREMSGVLALQSDVASAVAEQIRLELTPEERVALSPPNPVDPEAYDAYLRGLQLRADPDRFGALLPAIEQLERAVELDPEFADAHAALAGARARLASGLLPQYRGEFPKAREAAEKALELDANLGRAHAVLALVQLYEWDISGAGRAYERAFRLSPSDAWALGGYGFYLLMVGRVEEGLAILGRRVRISPLDREARRLNARNLYFARLYERSLAEYQRLLNEDPEFTDILLHFVYYELGRLEEAQGAVVAYYLKCGPPCDSAREARERGYAEGGWEASVSAWLEVAAPLAERKLYTTTAVGFYYAMLGETDEAFAWLERGYRDRDPLMIVLKAHPLSDSLRSDPRFDDLLRRIGFPES